MKKTLQIENQTLNFIYSESAKCFMTTEFINEIKVNFEIYEDEYNQKSIHWEEFKEFVLSIKKSDVLPQLITKSQKLLLELADAFGSSIEANEKIEDFQMIFCGLQFKGLTDNNFYKGLYNYSLWFSIQNKKYEQSYVDPYGAYITDIEGRFITGARRQQC
jgi:hypothetical protein